MPSPTSATGSSPQPIDGKTASVLGDPDQPHTYTYIPDIGEGLAVLGEHPDAAGQVWHLPNDPHTRTTRQLCQLVFQLAGTAPGRVRQLPPLLLRLVAVANPTVRELLEMQYQFAEPFIVDSTKITNLLGVHATPVEQALADTLATYQPTTTSPTPLTPDRPRDGHHHTRSTDHQINPLSSKSGHHGHDNPRRRPPATRIRCSRRRRAGSG